MFGKLIKIGAAAVAAAGVGIAVWWYRKTSSKPIVTAADLNASIRDSQTLRMRNNA